MNLHELTIIKDTVLVEFISGFHVIPCCSGPESPGTGSTWLGSTRCPGRATTWKSWTGSLERSLKSKLKKYQENIND